MHIPDHVQAEIDAGALFVINHSGGKDSQAMTAKLAQVLPPEHQRYVELEERTGYTMSMQGKSLREIVEGAKALAA